ncbi:class I SAM-dependent methyltransferase [soil metagenome]|jgi:SAM-dependent methyltransferase
MARDPNDVTIETYDAAAGRYAEWSSRHDQRPSAFLDEFAVLTRGGKVLEVGSGPGADADYLEQRGVQVSRSDASTAFVEMMRAAGHDAQLLDIRTADLGGPYRGVLAQAVLLHLDREQFVDVLDRFRAAVAPGGIVGFTVKEGDGSGWSTAKLDLPRHFTYWREPELRAALAGTAWQVHSIVHVDGRTEPWINVLARAG